MTIALRVLLSLVWITGSMGLFLRLVLASGGRARIAYQRDGTIEREFSRGLRVLRLTEHYRWCVQRDLIETDMEGREPMEVVGTGYLHLGNDARTQIAGGLGTLSVQAWPSYSTEPPSGRELTRLYRWLFGAVEFTCSEDFLGR